MTLDRLKQGAYNAPTWSALKRVIKAAQKAFEAGEITAVEAEEISATCWGRANLCRDDTR